MIRPLGIYVPMYVVCTDYSIQFLRTTIKVIADVSCGNNPIQLKVWHLKQIDFWKQKKRVNWINRYYFCELNEIGTKSDTDRYAFPKLGIYLHMFLFTCKCTESSTVFDQCCMLFSIFIEVVMTHNDVLPHFVSPTYLVCFNFKV